MKWSNSNPAEGETTEWQEKYAILPVLVGEIGDEYWIWGEKYLERKKFIYFLEASPWDNSLIYVGRWRKQRKLHE